MVPVKLEAIQLVAQFCLFGDLILLILLVLKIVGSILRNLLVILSITALIMVIVYTASNYDQNFTGNMIETAKTFIANLLKNNPLQKNH